MIEKGTLLHVISDHIYTDKRIEEHGRLWIVEETERNNMRYRCRSLATGSRFVWLVDEVQEAPPCNPDS